MQESTKLKLYKSNEIEVVVNEDTGETFASISATARMCHVEPTTITRFIKGCAEKTRKKASVQTPG